MQVKIIKQNGYNFLWIDNYLWMWDIPVERKVQEKIATEAYGDVLIAGYGLGLVQYYLTKNPKVKSITTLEKNEAVVREVHRVYKKIYGNIINKDFYKFKTKNKYDCVIGDIWEDIVEDSLNDYNRFLRKAKLLIKPKGKILAWGKEFFDYLNTKSK